jgi:ATP-dependent protease ClpP protease subunit
MSEAEKCDEMNFVYAEGGDIFFYCDVSEESVTEFLRVFKRVETEMRTNLVKMGLYDQMPRITVHIKSDGGDLYSGLAAFDFLRASTVHVTTIAEGCVASASTSLFLGGDVRIVRPSSYILIHQIGSTFWGKFENMKDEMRHCKQLMRLLRRIYLRETDIPAEKLDLMLKRDIYLSARKCIKYGIQKI